MPVLVRLSLRSHFRTVHLPYCLPPGARTSGLHAAYFGIYVSALRSALGATTAYFVHLTYARCLLLYCALLR